MTSAPARPEFQHDQPRLRLKPPVDVDPQPSFQQILAGVYDGPGKSSLASVSVEIGGGKEGDNGHALIFNQEGYFGPFRSSKRVKADIESTDEPGPVRRPTADAPNDWPLGPDAIEPRIEIGPEAARPTTQKLSVAEPELRIHEGRIPASRIEAKTTEAKPFPATFDDPILATSDVADETSAEPPANGTKASAGVTREPSYSGASLNVQVNLGPVGEALNLSVRLGKLSRMERAQLRDEIVQLLARYGISAGEILLNGEIEPTPGL